MGRNVRGLKRGGPGRPKGQPNKATLEVRAFALQFVADPAYQENLKKRIVAGQANHMEPLLWYYAYGKPKEMDNSSGRGFQMIFMGVERGHDPLAMKSKMLQRMRAEKRSAAPPAAPFDVTKSGQEPDLTCKIERAALSRTGHSGYT